MTDTSHICALKCIHSQHVPVQFLSNALSLGILFYYLQSPQPFTFNPWNFKLHLVHMFLSFAIHLSPRLSVLSSIGLCAPQGKGSVVLVPLSHVYVSQHVNLLFHKRTD